MLKFLAKSRRKRFLIQLGLTENKAEVLSDYSFVDTIKTNKRIFESDFLAFFQADPKFRSRIQSVGLTKEDIIRLIENVEQINKGSMTHLTIERGLEVALKRITDLAEQRNLKGISKRLKEIVSKPVKNWKPEETDFYNRHDYVNFIILVAVYGHLSAGKSYFAHKLIMELKKHGYSADTNDSTPEPFYYDVYDKKSTTYLPLIYNASHVRICQVPWYRDQSAKGQWQMERDPNIQLQRLVQRGMDLNIAIYNPNAMYPKGKYDLVIHNPESRNKATGSWI